MTNNATINQLHELRLHVMAATLREQEGQPDIQALPFEERLALMVEAGWLSRRDKKVDRLISHADFRFSSYLEDIDYQDRQGISKPDIIRLSSGSYIKKKLNVIICGPTGVGKTFLACALGRAACSQGVQVNYSRVPDLFLRLADAQAAGTYLSLRDKITKTSLLILDDWGLKKFTLDETYELMELVERRYARSATIILSQIPHGSWHDLFPDPTLADAILDRLIHNAYKFTITGDSMRKVLAKRDLESS
jgi:DNA replication protein DnaC